MWKLEANSQPFIVRKIITIFSLNEYFSVGFIHICKDKMCKIIMQIHNQNYFQCSKSICSFQKNVKVCKSMQTYAIICQQIGRAFLNPLVKQSVTNFTKRNLRNLAKHLLEYFLHKFLQTYLRLVWRKILLQLIKECCTKIGKFLVKIIF